MAEPFYSRCDPGGLQLPDNFNRLGENKPEIHRNFQGVWGIGTYPEEQQRRLIGSYLGYVACIDDQVGRILAALEELGLAEETMVIFVSDHGDMLGAHGLYDKGPFMYDDIYRVPLMVRAGPGWPRRGGARPWSTTWTWGRRCGTWPAASRRKTGRPAAWRPSSRGRAGTWGAR